MNTPWNNGLFHDVEGMDLLPTSIELSGTEVTLFQAMSSAQILKNILSDCPVKYDYVFHDGFHCVIMTWAKTDL